MVKRFRTPWLKEMARTIEGEFGPAFREHDATLKLVPIRISHLVEVGEGVELTLFPDEPKHWEWWGDFESDIETARRKRLSRAWRELRNRTEVEDWLRAEVQRYLERLESAADVK